MSVIEQFGAGSRVSVIQHNFNSPGSVGETVRLSSEGTVVAVRTFPLPCPGQAAVPRERRG